MTSSSNLFTYRPPSLGARRVSHCVLRTAPPHGSPIAAAWNIGAVAIVPPDRVSGPLNAAERDADQLVGRQTRITDPIASISSTVGNTLQRECAECEEEQQRVSRKEGSAGTELDGAAAPAIVHDVLGSAGSPLEPTTLAFMERRFGHDFSRVRVHADSAADASARAVRARAYTVGHNIVFANGQYAPATASGRRLIAHELAHVVQQYEAATGTPSALTIAPAGDRYEVEADRMAKAVTSESAPAWSAAGLGQGSGARMRLHRQPCKKSDDHIVTGPLQAKLPDIDCDPSAVTLAAVRAVPGVPQSILGVTEAKSGGQEIRYQEIFANKCKATIVQYDTLAITSMYTKADNSAYDDGTEVTPAGRACPRGRTIARKLKITEDMAKKIKQGEIDHCNDKKLAFALTFAKWNQAIKDLEGEYCPGGPPTKEGPPCQKEFAQRFKDRTGIDFDKQKKIGDCLMQKSSERDTKKWHDVHSDQWAYAPDCSSVTYIANPALSPEIGPGKHPSSEIVKGCGEK